ncbi:polysaccharide deacetylase family protein [Levilactobacillus spicheri]
MRHNWKIWGGSLLLIALIGGAVAWRQAVTRTAPATTTETTRGTHAATASSATVTRTRATTWQTLKHPLKLPILMYHSISHGNQLRVPAAQFRREMVYLKRHHYRTLTTQEAIRALTTNTVPQKKVVWITLDDAYRDNLTRALPILKETHLHATINVITGFTHKANHLSLAEMRAMRRTGTVDFASHTVQYLDLNALTAAQQRKELVASKRWLDHHLDQNTRLLCYPAGRANATTRKLAKAAGYQLALTTQEGVAQLKQGRYNLARLRITPGMTTATFAALVNVTNS